MKRKQLSMAINGALAVSLLIGAPAIAQDAPAAKQDGEKVATTLQSVTVTARKREETLQDVPVAVTAFTADSLDKLNIEDLSDLDAQVPNLTIYAARGSSSTVTATPTAPMPTPSEAAEVRALMVAASLAAMLTGPLAVTPVTPVSAFSI